MTGTSKGTSRLEDADPRRGTSHPPIQIRRRYGDRHRPAERRPARVSNQAREHDDERREPARHWRRRCVLPVRIVLARRLQPVGRRRMLMTWRCSTSHGMPKIGRNTTNATNPQLDGHVPTPLDSSHPPTGPGTSSRHQVGSGDLLTRVAAARACQP